MPDIEASRVNELTMAAQRFSVLLMPFPYLLCLHRH